MEIDNDDTTTARSALVATYVQSEDAPIDLAPVTSSDMYGIRVDVVGRRSFGGFNRVMEDTWKASYRAQKEGDASKSKGETISDEELLTRYANLAKQRNGDDASRRPVGNLGDKKKYNFEF